MCFHLCFSFDELSMRSLALLFHWLVVFFLPDCYGNTGLLIWGDAMGPRADADLLPRGGEELGAPGAAGRTIWLLWNTEPGVWGPGSRTAGKGEWEAGRKRGKDGSLQ